MIYKSPEIGWNLFRIHHHLGHILFVNLPGNQRSGTRSATDASMTLYDQLELGRDLRSLHNKERNLSYSQVSIISIAGWQITMELKLPSELSSICQYSFDFPASYVTLLRGYSPHVPPHLPTPLLTGRRGRHYCGHHRGRHHGTACGAQGGHHGEGHHHSGGYHWGSFQSGSAKWKSREPQWTWMGVFVTGWCEGRELGGMVKSQTIIGC